MHVDRDVKKVVTYHINVTRDEAEQLLYKLTTFLQTHAQRGDTCNLTMTYEMKMEDYDE